MSNSNKKPLPTTLSEAYDIGFGDGIEFARHSFKDPINEFDERYDWVDFQLLTTDMQLARLLNGTKYGR